MGTGNFIEVWQKESDGAWRIIRDVWNTNADVATNAGRDVEAVKGAVASHWAAINQGDTATIGRQHTSDFTMFMAEMPTRLGDFTETSPEYKRLVAAKADWKVRDVQVQPLGDGSAVASFFMDGAVKWADGTVDRRPRRVSEVWVNQGGVWKEAHHHDSVLTPLR